MGFLRSLGKIGGALVGGAVGFFAGGGPITSAIGAGIGASAGSWLGEKIGGFGEAVGRSQQDICLREAPPILRDNITFRAIRKAEI